ncbi:MAG: transglutaminase-like domain-containing protein [Candidatus Binatia bacterium]
MVGPLAGCAPAVLILLATGLAAAPVPGKSERWRVTVALRISAENGTPVAVDLALPPDGPAQRLGPVEVTGRGLTSEVVTSGTEPHVHLAGKFKGARRVAVQYVVERDRDSTTLPQIAVADAPGPELLPFLSPSPLFQTRSLLVRDFMESYVAPMLDTPGADLVRTIMRATREHLPADPAGKTLTLDVIRAGGGRRIGVERAFTTFVRAAGVPARFVEGVKLGSGTHRKRVFWTEVWDGNRWWAASASGNWFGSPPAGYIALTRDGRRVLTKEGKGKVSYTVNAVRVEDPT